MIRIVLAALFALVVMAAPATENDHDNSERKPGVKLKNGITIRTTPDRVDPKDQHVPGGVEIIIPLPRSGPAPGHTDRQRFPFPIDR